MKILRIDSSPRRRSDTRALTQTIVDAIGELHEVEVVERDLAASPPSHITEAWIEGTHGARDDAAALAAASESDALVDELRSADVIVIGAPMYNFTVTSSLKAWIDQIARGGKTFTFAGGQLRGLLKDRPVFIALSRAADYSPGSPMAALDFQQPYLRHVLGFVGLHDVHFIPHVHSANETANRELLSQAASRARAIVAAVFDRDPATAGASRSR